MKNEIVTQKQQEQGMQWLDVAYGQAIKGIGLGDTSVEKMAGDYLAKYSSAEEACKAMLKNQVKKCTSSGVITGFGGFTTLPFTLPLNVTSVLYMQLRMIACTAYLAEYSPSSDQTETLVLACLVGEPLTQVAKQAGVKLGTRVATNAIKKIPGRTLTKINQAIGCRFITKFGTKGIVNLGKAVPLIGAGVGGAFDYFGTRTIADRAYKAFFEGRW